MTANRDKNTFLLTETLVFSYWLSGSLCGTLQRNRMIIATLRPQVFLMRRRSDVCKCITQACMK